MNKEWELGIGNWELNYLVFEFEQSGIISTILNFDEKDTC